MNKYLEMKKRHQKELNKLPFICAFSDDQLKESMKKSGLKYPDDLNQLVSVTPGTFIKQDNVSEMQALFRKHKKERKEALASDKDGTGFIYQMFYHELCNYEYGYTEEVDDTLDALGLTLDDINADKRLLKGFNKAKKDVIRNAVCW